MQKEEEPAQIVRHPPVGTGLLAEPREKRLSRPILREADDAGNDDLEVVDEETPHAWIKGLQEDFEHDRRLMESWGAFIDEIEQGEWQPADLWGDEDEAGRNQSQP